jgi:UDP-3-O-[3-hydroxymyristoyl] glucosamine N-acyltransferase
MRFFYHLNFLSEVPYFQGRKDQLVTTTVRQLAELVRGTFHGDGDLVINMARTLHEAKPGDITFVEHKQYWPQLHHSKASAAIVPLTMNAESDKVLVKVQDPLMAFVTIVQHLQDRPAVLPTGIATRAVIHPSATIGADAFIDSLVRIGENCVVGKRCRLYSGVVLGRNCRLGDDVVLHPNVVLYDGTIVGDRVIIHANAVLGADGFGYRFQQGRHVKVPQLGHVEIGCDVEIGAGTTIDRGAFDATMIGDGTKIDNLVQIAHNCRIGKHNMIASQTGIAGSCITGNYVMMGGQVGVKDHINIGEGAMIGAKSGIIHDVAPAGRMFGYPATEERESARVLATMKKLPEMRKDLLRVLKHLGIQNEDIKEQAA